MKKHILFLGVLMVILSSSCKKEPIVYPTEQYGATVPTLVDNKGISLWGKYVIIDAIMYVDNNETGQKTVYNHFSSTKNRSSLRWGGSIFDIEEIIKDSTTYSFYSPPSIPGFGKFVLNGDTSKHYSSYYIGLNRTIVEDPTHNEQNMGGSARPFSSQTISKTDKIIAIEIEEVEGSINGYNCRYWTQLKLKKIEEY